jgi:hypothetical protein
MITTGNLIKEDVGIIGIWNDKVTMPDDSFYLAQPVLRSAVWARALPVRR